MRTTNQLPLNYANWTALVNYVKVNIPDAYNTNIRVANNQNPSNDENGVISIYEIDMDYAKARAFEELGTIPNYNECVRAMIELNAFPNDKEFLEAPRAFMRKLADLQRYN